MNCNGVAGSIIRDCYNTNGGVSEFKIKAWDSTHTGYSVASGVATMSGGALSGWKTLECEPETSMASDDGTTDPTTGTTVYEPTLTYVYNKRKASVRNAVANLHGNRWIVLEKSEAGDIWMYGYDRGMVVTTSNATSGTALNERNGYTLTMKGRESQNELSVSNSWSAFYDA